MIDLWSTDQCARQSVAFCETASAASVLQETNDDGELARCRRKECCLPGLIQGVQMRGDPAKRARGLLAMDGLGAKPSTPPHPTASVAGKQRQRMPVIYPGLEWSVSEVFSAMSPTGNLDPASAGIS